MYSELALFRSCVKTVITAKITETFVFSKQGVKEIKAKKNTRMLRELFLRHDGKKIGEKIRINRNQLRSRAQHTILRSGVPF